MISAEVQILDAPHFHRLTPSQSRTGGAEAIVAGNDVGQGWAVEWRRSVRMQEGRAVPLPLPPDKRRFASMRELLKASTRPLGALHRYMKRGEGGKAKEWEGGEGREYCNDLAICTPLLPHRCNFALMLLSELVLELQEVDWRPHLPLLLHVVLLGLDIFRPLVCEHAKRLLGNLVVVLACRDDKMAALQARWCLLGMRNIQLQLV